MSLKKISISNFRCFDNIELIFSDFNNFVYGSNGSGKTSILEALYFCSTGRSFKSSNKDFCIQKNKNAFKIQLETLSNNKICISKEFKKSIKYYSLLLEKLDENTDAYADVLYKRGSSYERIGDYKNSDKGLLQSLSIKPNDPYVLNYLGYGWLERGFKIKDAIIMLDKAYNQKKNDPFIIDSVGWGYYLIGDYDNAENFLRKAIQLMPNDPVVNDHYGDAVSYTHLRAHET